MAFVPRPWSAERYTEYYGSSEIYEQEHLDVHRSDRYGSDPLSLGFREIRLPAEPRCFLAPAFFNAHSLLKIKDLPDGLNSRLAVENSPSRLLLSKIPTLIIGTDVAHDCCPGDYDSPSIAAVVHSRQWPEVSQFRQYVQMQPPKTEAIDSLYKPVLECDGKIRDFGIMSELLQDFCASSGNRKPEQIIIFRYGDSALQLTQVLDAEVKQIIQACRCFDNEWSPKFLVIKFFKHGAPDNGPYRTAKGDKLLWAFRRHLSQLAGMIDTTMPLLYHVGIDEIGLSANDLQELVDSLSYVHQLRTFAISTVAPFWFGLKKTQSEERSAKRMKTKIQPDEVNLDRVREYISGGEELALYALGHLNADETGAKYDLERYLHDAEGHYGYDCDNMKWWQHVSMYAREWNGDNVSRTKIIFAELCYSDGKYESIAHSVLDPIDRSGIRYGCGMCFPSYWGPRMTPHPADRSKYVVGRWAYQYNTLVFTGLLFPEHKEPQSSGKCSRAVKLN